MKKVVVKAPAKVNLALDILGITDNGYHQMDMLMQAVGLYEEVEVARSMGYALRCPGSRVPANAKNTATKAAAAFFRETGLLAGADITVHKRVPTRAGMGGGSADAAAVLVGLNALYRARLSIAELCEIGLQVGADVPFALLGGTARVGGIGEVLEPLPALPPCWLAVAMPQGGMSTPVAYKRYDTLGSTVHPNIDAAVDALHRGDLRGMAQHMQNTMEPTSGDAMTAKIRAALDKAGALASLMTGSGAAVFGVFETEEKARAASAPLKALVQQAFVVPSVQNGPVIVKTIE